MTLLPPCTLPPPHEVVGIGRLGFQDLVMFLFWYRYALRTEFPSVCPFFLLLRSCCTQGLRFPILWVKELDVSYSYLPSSCNIYKRKKDSDAQNTKWELWLKWPLRKVLVFQRCSNLSEAHPQKHSWVKTTLTCFCHSYERIQFTGKKLNGHLLCSLICFVAV